MFASPLYQYKVNLEIKSMPTTTQIWKIHRTIVQHSTVFVFHIFLITPFALARLKTNFKERSKLDLEMKLIILWLANKFGVGVGWSISDKTPWAERQFLEFISPRC